MSNKKTRLKYYIDKEFQNKFILRFLSIILISGLLSLALVWLVRSKSYSLLPDGASTLVQIDASKGLYLSQNEEGEVSLDNNGMPYFPPKIIDGIMKQYNAFDLYLYPILFVTLLNLAIIIIFGLFFSHSMAGPIYKIKKTLRKYIESGDYESIALRKKDQFQDLANLINKAIKKDQ